MHKKVKLTEYDLRENYEELMKAIIELAVEDYKREYRKSLLLGYWTSKLRKLNCFFNSSWANDLSFGNAKRIKDHIRVEVEEEVKKKHLKHYNERINRVLTYKGQSKTIREWAAELNISPNGLARRIERGWSIKRALSTKGALPQDGKMQ